MCFDVSLLSGCVCVFFLWKLFLYALVCFICFASSAVFGNCLYMFFFRWILCILDVSVFSFVLLAPLFSRCVCLCLSDKLFLCHSIVV